MVRISVELPDEVAEALSLAASALQSTPEALAAVAIRDRLTDQSALDASLAAAEAEIEAGLGIPHEAVMQEMRAWASALHARNAKG